MAADEIHIFDAFKRHGVPFLIVGGHAVNFHGHLRQTEDTDIVWIRSPEAEKALASALAEIDAQYIGKEIDPSTGIERTYPVSLQFIQARDLMMLCTKFGFLDLFSYVPGHPDADVEAFYDAGVDSKGLRYASLQWLQKMKTASGRSKDLEDLEKLGSK